jgi:hypothetical protein
MRDVESTVDKRRGLVLRQVSACPPRRLAELGRPVEDRDLRQGVRAPRGVAPEAGDVTRVDGVHRRGDVRADVRLRN